MLNFIYHGKNSYIKNEAKHEKDSVQYHVKFFHGFNTRKGVDWLKG